MTVYKIRYIAVILFIVSPFVVLAQQQNTDSISIFELMDAVEKNTSCRIYTTIATPFKVKRSETSKPTAESLRQALAATRYKVTVYADQIFILPETFLSTTLTPVLKGEQIKDSEQASSFIPIVKSSSENKVYEIGNRYKPSSEATVILNGKVTDFKTGQELEGINVVHREPWVATVTDRQGNFTIQLPVGYNTIEINGLNIKETRRQFMLYGEGNTHIELEEEDHLLDEVIIVSGRVQNVRSTQLGMEKFQPSLLKNIPTAMGEVDVLKMLQTLPGIKTVGEASSGYNVRGSAADQNLLLLNNGTIYNPNHLFGFFTAFNSDMIKDAELYKSSIPSQYGGRIASVLNITSKEASKEKFTGSAGIGLVTSKLNLEIPIIKEKTSLLLSGRTTYSDWILKKLPEKSGYKDGNAGFYDLNATINHKFDERNNLYLNGYYSHDRFRFNADERYAYENANASVKWRHIFSDRFTGVLTAGYDHYGYNTRNTDNPVNAYSLAFRIDQMYGKMDFTHYLSDKHTLDFGASSLFYGLEPGKYLPYGGESLVKEDRMEKEKAVESAIYVGDRWDITSQLSLNVGVRYSIFNVLGPRTYNLYADDQLPSLATVTGTVDKTGAFKTYHGPEFRISARYAFTEDFSVKAGFNTMRQNIHKLSNTTIMSPTDTWKLSDANIKPQTGMQVAAGLYRNFLSNTIEVSLEGYYKTMKDYLDYRNGAELLMNHHIETDVLRTEGRAYGVELMVKKTQGKLNGWVSYTYSRTQLRQNDPMIVNPVNKGDWYAADFDKPHDLKFVGNYKFTHRFSFSLNCDYSTGRPITLPVSKYHYGGGEFVYYSDRNQYRIPDFFRMDASFNIEPSHHLTLLTHSTISFGVYNLTGRKNAYSVYYISENGKLKGYKMAIFGVPIPFVSYNIKF
mgnify:CR=1 FL=1